MGGQSEYVVETVELTKKYGDFTAVDNLSLCIKEGEIFGLLGPNGAGKTTTILMLLGLTEPTAGVARVCGHNSTREPLAVKSIVGYLPDNVGFYEDLSARENLRYTADLNGLSLREADRRIDDLLERVGLADVAGKKVGKYSRGMRQRLGIADVLVKNPKLVFLDEPTLGIDPDGVRQMLQIIVRMTKEDRITVLLSSHLLHQVQQICHRVGIFVKGRMVAEGPIGALSTQVMGGQPLVVEVQSDPMNGKLAESLEELDGVLNVTQTDDLLLVGCTHDIRADVARHVVESGASLLHLRMREFGLEDIYLKYFREG